MSSMRLCRICLAEHLKLYSISNTPYHEMYEQFTGAKLIEDGRPATLCCYCYSQFLRFCKFYRMLQEAEKYFTEMVVYEPSASLKREHMYNLSVSPLQLMSVPDPVAIDTSVSFKKELVEEEEYKVIIKDEDIMVDTMLLMEDSGDMVHTRDVHMEELVHTGNNMVNTNRNTKSTGDNIKGSSNVVYTEDISEHSRNKRSSGDIGGTRNIVHAGNVEHIENLVNTENMVPSQDTVHAENKVNSKDRVRTKNMVHTRNKVHSKKIVRTKNKVHSKKMLHSKEIVHTENKVHSKDEHSVIEIESEEDTAVHTDTEEQFSCQECEKAFRFQHQLNFHMKLHASRLRNFVCHYCRKKYSAQSSLTIHLMRIHSKYEQAARQLKT